MKRWQLADGGTLEESEHNGDMRYVQRDAEGTLCRTYEARTDSVEDSLYKTSFVVRAGRLTQHTVIETYDEPTETKERVVLEGLGQSEQSLAEQRVATPTVDGHKNLTDRVRQHDDKLAAALLRELHGLAALRGELTKNASVEARKAFAAANDELEGTARIITFADTAEDREVAHYPHSTGATPKPPTGPLLEDARAVLGQPGNAMQQQARQLFDHLEELLRDLVFHADMQGYVDARGNESAYLRAATRISRAATLIATACRSC